MFYFWQTKARNPVFALHDQETILTTEHTGKTVKSIVLAHLAYNSNGHRVKNEVVNF